jgi:peptidoglycan/LPS O-acetylase OafA/YrhL
MYKHLPSPVNFREDINGLRAWAVIGVLLFHFSLIGLPGGFVGVDIFFVISGYLMTAIIVSKLEKGKFKLVDFYMARIRRILPALLVLIAILLVLGWFWLPTLDYQELGKQSAYSLAFLSNIGYWKSAGYFNGAAHEKWLLHTWSLGVEAQFYVLYPLLVTAVWYVWPKIKILTIVLIIVFILSFGLNITLVEFKPITAFYLLPTRGWELAAGGLVYLLARQLVLNEAKTNLLFWLGWTLLLLSFVLINPELAWPGYWALLPVMGVSLIIFANNQDCKLTNNAIAQWIGVRSYSLYLWHWPLVVALYFSSLQTNWLWVACIFLLSLVLAHISYHFVEIPTRSYLTRRTLKKEVLLIALIVIIIGASSVLIKFSGFEHRLNPEVELATNGALDKNPREEACFEQATAQGSPSCKYGHGDVGAILLGDSHADAIIGGLAKTSTLFSKSVIEWALSGCPPMFNAKYTHWEKEYSANRHRCLEFNAWAFNQSKQYSETIPVILLARLTSYLNGGVFNDLVKTKPRVYFTKEYSDASDVHLQKEFSQQIVSDACRWSQTRPVYLMRPIPEMHVDVPKTLGRNILLNRGGDDIKITLKEYQLRHKLVWQAQDKAVKQCGVRILNPLPYLCDDQYCYGSKNGHSLYFDDDHLSESGNELLIPMFKEIFE